jgi:hypothetical protein
MDCKRAVVVMAVSLATRCGPGDGGSRDAGRDAPGPFVDGGGGEDAETDAHGGWLRIAVPGEIIATSARRARP